MNKKQRFEEEIKKIRHQVKPVLDYDLNSPNIFCIDLTDNNPELNDIILQDTVKFTNYISGEMKKQNALVAIGRYDENRSIYSRSELFKAETNPRTVHLGIDLFTKGGGTRVYAPLTGRIHSFKNNKNFGDFGPTIILEHRITGVTFYTLYGHLSVDSLNGLKEGAEITAGSEIARIGNYPVNGDWPPHLHFQIITDMQGKKGDFWGVCSLADRKHYLEICPDPNSILNIQFLM